MPYAQFTRINCTGKLSPGARESVSPYNHNSEVRLHSLSTWPTLGEKAKKWANEQAATSGDSSPMGNIRILGVSHN